MEYRMSIRFMIFMIIVIQHSVRLASAEAPKPEFHVPPGFTVEKVAGPPLVRYPLFACFDDRGRLFVAEGTGTNLPGEELRKKQLGRILLLEDKDGDGTFDTSKVFADGLVAPQGVLWHDGALYTASHPSLWKLEDTDGRDVATRRTELVTGFGFNGNGCDIHGPFLGPDGWLYWTGGRHGYDVKTRDGVALQGLAARIWRCRTDGTQVERICGGGFDNPVELVFTPEGEPIVAMDQGTGDCLLHCVEGGVFPMEHPCLREFPRTGPLLGAVRQYSAVLPAALCGLMRYRSSTFGPEFQNRLLSTQYMLHKIVRHELIRQGSTFRAEDTDFLTSTTHDLRLTDVLEDADGSVLFVDMGAWFTYGFPGNPPPRPDALGAIYRIKRTELPKVADPWGKALKIETLSAKELIELLDDARPMVQDQAMARLVRLARLDDAVTPRVWSGLARGETARCNAVWVLCRIGSDVACQDLNAALTDPAESVRIAAIHALGRVRSSEAGIKLRGIIERGSLPERRAAAEASWHVGDHVAVPALLSGLPKEADRFLEHSITYALIQFHDEASTRRALTDADPRMQRCALIALDQMKNARIREEEVAPLLEAADHELRHAALDVVSRHAGWSKTTLAFLKKQLTTASLSEDDQRALSDLVLQNDGDPSVQLEVSTALNHAGTPSTTRKLLLRAISQSHLGQLPALWIEALSRSLASSDPEVQREVVSTIQARKLTQFDRPLAELGHDERANADLRIAALECLAGRLGSPDPKAYTLLLDHLSESTEPLLRLAAARALSASQLTREQQIQLASATEHSGTIVLRLLLPIFAKGDDLEVGKALVRALERSPSAEALSPAELDQTVRAYPQEIRERAQGLRKKLAELQKEKAAYLATLTAELEPVRGNSDTGHELFLSQKLGCIGCHRAVGRGGTVGPDLSRIGKFRTKAELLESIVFPGRTIAPEFRAYQVATKDGRVATGLIVRETTDAIMLLATDLAEVRVARSELEAMTPSTTSLMPEGLEKLMSRQELGDLLEFLSQQQ
jgi:putative heme-binding domain-containing protein